ncbi:unnamed protein product [Lepeophtheirus salmonis]|uniref:(salmon louse) hypothetical protein n=1 Tax=Lepeophtheirus salmonis TaxID=72036 RepID=A0A7R8D3V7_LEPSM|nr:unnamed protein product [Lepeophtheirus salmonis]CAF3019763.1 unnamed protein product [Lepeophtheirus salmonis]
MEIQASLIQFMRPQKLSKRFFAPPRHQSNAKQQLNQPTDSIFWGSSNEGLNSTIKATNQFEEDFDLYVLDWIDTAPIIDPILHIIKKGDPEYHREILEDPLRHTNNTKIKDPEKKIKKWAHRMLRIRKRKMKVHPRKKRWRKKNKVFYQSRIFNRIKSREIAFRTALLDKIKSAEAFDPENYVKEYLEDYNTPLIPLTYKGRRLPVWLIKELLVQDELNKRRELDLQLNMLSKKPLVREGETVDNFSFPLFPFYSLRFMLLLIYGTVKYNTKVILVCIALLSIIILWNIIDAIVITSKFIHEREAVPSIFSLVVSCFHLYMLYVLKALL